MNKNRILNLIIILVTVLQALLVTSLVLMGKAFVPFIIVWWFSIMAIYFGGRLLFALQSLKKIENKTTERLTKETCSHLREKRETLIQMLAE